MSDMQGVEGNQLVCKPPAKDLKTELCPKPFDKGVALRRDLAGKSCG
jgi:hypothetical protein